MSNSTLILETHHSGFTDFIGVIAMVISVVQLTGLINNIIDSIKNNNLLVKIENLHLLFLIAETGCWSIYGIKLKAFPIYLSNMALFLIYFAALLSSFWVTQDINNLAKHAGITVVSWIIGYSMFSKNLAGFAAFILKFLSCYFIYNKIYFTLEKKSNEGIELNEIYFGLGAYGTWVLYGMFFALYPFVWIPNLAYLILYSLYLVAYLWTTGKITDNGLLIVYTKKLFQVETVEFDTDPKQMKKRLRDDF